MINDKIWLKPFFIYLSKNVCHVQLSVTFHSFIHLFIHKLIHICTYMYFATLSVFGFLFCTSVIIISNSKHLHSTLFIDICKTGNRCDLKFNSMNETCEFIKSINIIINFDLKKFFVEIVKQPGIREYKKNHAVNVVWLDLWLIWIWWIT